MEVNFDAPHEAGRTQVLEDLLLESLNCDLEYASVPKQVKEIE